jgi:hypothetical protein
VHVDVIPNGKVPCKPLVEISIGLFDAAEGLIGEDDSKPKGVLGRVLLPDLDAVVRVEELDQGRQV